MTIELDGGEEITNTEYIPIIPEGITTDQIIKMGLKAKKVTFERLKIKPQDKNLTYDGIFPMAVKHNIFEVKDDYFGTTLYLKDYCSIILTTRKIKEMTADEIVDSILKTGISQGFEDFEKISVQPLDDNITDQDILNEAKNAGLFEFEEIKVGTGNYKETSKSVALYDSRKRNLQNNVTFSMKSPDSKQLGEFD